MSWEKKVGESEYEYVYRLGSNKDAIGTWQDVADILNAELGYEYTESRYRKMYQSFTKMFDENRERFVEKDTITNDMLMQKIDLEKERRKIQAEKIEYNAWIRESARDELIMEKVLEAIEKLTPIEVPNPIKTCEDVSCKEYMLLFGDEHFGSEFEIHGINGEIINKYSPDIFMQRMWKLLDYTIDIVKEKNIKKLNVFSLGDSIDGVLRISQLGKLKYGVVDSAIMYEEFMSAWLAELSKYVIINFYPVDGNHSELRMFNQPRGSFKNENMGKIIRAYIKMRLDGNKNFNLIDNPSGVALGSIAGFNVAAVHGESKNMEQALKDISNVYRQQIDYLIAGHLHHDQFETVGINRGVIRIPSIVGTDEFSIGLNKASRPAAKLIEMTEGVGKTVEYTLDLGE